MGQLAASIAHEVNQPISAAVINANAALNWLGRQPPDLEKVRQALARVVKDGKRAGEIVGRIRDLIKKAPPRQERLDINGAIRELIELTRGEAMKNRVSVKTELEEGLPLIRGDRVQLQQVILNLIVNAVQAMSRLSEGHRELRVSTAQTPSGDVLVEVRDSGPGLPPDTLEQLFEAFYTTKPGGWASGCRSAVRLSKRTKDGSGLRRTYHRGPRFSLPSLARLRSTRPPKHWTVGHPASDVSGPGTARRIWATSQTGRRYSTTSCCATGIEVPERSQKRTSAKP